MSPVTLYPALLSMVATDRPWSPVEAKTKTFLRLEDMMLILVGVHLRWCTRKLYAVPPKFAVSVDNPIDEWSRR